MVYSILNKSKSFPNGLTSYDLLKTLAILLMLVDHAGYFFFMDEMWFRVIGRLSVPIWFFLIGFSTTREVPKLFWIAAVLVMLSTIAAGEYLFPLNILFTLIIARMVADWLYHRAMRNKEAFAGMFFFLFLLSGPTLIFSEYGTLGLLFTLMGAICRNRDKLLAPRWMLLSYHAACLFGYIIVQGLLMPELTQVQFWFLVVCMAGLQWMFHRFDKHVFEGWTPQKFFPLYLVQFTGRYTLEIYVVHLIVLRAIVVMTQPERFEPFQVRVFAFQPLQEFFFGFM
ncbi:MAG: hypothetical protein JKY71_09370 [Alphaproteobacteria bacterium]|nr:hypothetical protein [Alphaproteobacteria bacterium]